MVHRVHKALRIVLFRITELTCSLPGDELRPGQRHQPAPFMGLSQARARHLRSDVLVKLVYPIMNLDIGGPLWAPVPLRPAQVT